MLRDAFEALFHPDGRMALSRGVMRSKRDDRFSLPHVMPWLLGMAQRGLADDVSAPTRLAGMLCAAIDDFARSTAERFHGGVGVPTAVLLERYARDHLRDG